ncbi:MAG TPA: LysR family transcriptional regulator, partial [Mycobacteriales bacterium]|nr:LysR family transcriptional regulator [Mycobacteriales bacterium]
MLDVGRLRLLLAISEHGGTAGAARALGRPVTEVSTQVTDASQELGLALLDGDRLTPAGRRLAEHGARLLGQLEAAESDAAAVAGRLAGTLRLGVGADAGRALLADALPALRSAAPDLSVHVRQLADERVGALGSTLDVVVAGEYGAAVPHRADAAVERRELFTEPLLLAVPTRHRATGASVRLAELAGEAWIGGAGDALVALERAAAGAGFAPRLVAEVGEDALALTLVAAGQGVALVPASATPAPVDGVRFLTVLDGGLRRTVVAAVRRSAVADPGVRRLLEALAAAARRVAAAVPGVSAAAVSSPPPPSSAAQGAGGRRPDPLLDPLPETPPSARNGRRDPWADRMRPETNGSSHGGPGTSRNGYGGPGETPGRNGHSFPSDLSGLSGLAGRNGGADPLGGFRPSGRPAAGLRRVRPARP